MMTYVADKALLLFTHLSDMQFVSDPLIEKINTTYLTKSQVTKIISEAVIHLTLDL